MRTSLMTVLLGEVDFVLKSGEITQAQADQLKTDITEIYGERVETYPNPYAPDMSGFEVK